MKSVPGKLSPGSTRVLVRCRLSHAVCTDEAPGRASANWQAVLAAACRWWRSYRTPDEGVVAGLGVLRPFLVLCLLDRLPVLLLVVRRLTGNMLVQ